MALALKAADGARGVPTRTAKVDELLPPCATLTVHDQSNLPTVKLKVAAEAAVPQQPIIALRLLMDGRPVPGKETLTEFRDGKQQAEVEWIFELPEGEHQLAVLRVVKTLPAFRGRCGSSMSISPGCRRCTYYQ